MSYKKFKTQPKQFPADGFPAPFMTNLPHQNERTLVLPCVKVELIYKTVLAYQDLITVKVQMKCFFFIAEFEIAAKPGRSPFFYRFLISLLVPEL